MPPPSGEQPEADLDLTKPNGVHCCLPTDRTISMVHAHGATNFVQNSPKRWLWQDSCDLGLIIDGRFSLVVDGELFFCDLTEYFK